MGNTFTGNIKCPHCCATTRSDNHCERCHGALHSSNSRRSSLSTNTQSRGLLDSDLEAECVHLAPFQESLDANLREEMKDDELNHFLLNSIISPYFQRNTDPLVAGTSMQIRDFDFGILSCTPPGGKPCHRTEYILTDESGQLRRLNARPLQRIHILPTAASTEQKLDDAMREQVDQKLRVALLSDPPRHFTAGEVFESEDVQFRVMALEPSDGYFDGESTELFTAGDPIPDLKSVKLLPIYEALPNAHKDYSPTEIRERYLRHFIEGRYVFAMSGQRVDINGVQFFVEEAEPSQGLITFSTQIDNDGRPLRSEDLDQRQIAQDEELARRIQESQERPQIIFNGRGMPDDPGRRMLLQDLASRGEFLNLIEQLRNIQQQQRAMPTGALDRLPTYEFHPSHETPTGTAVDATEDEADHSSCRICLMEYEEGDMLRILPCFHKYHRDCIDTWLSRSSRKCPICKTDIARAMNGGP